MVVEDSGAKQSKRRGGRPGGDASYPRLRLAQSAEHSNRTVARGPDKQHVYERGWATLGNGALLAAAEHDGFDVPITTDGNLRYQQDLPAGQLAIVVLGTTSWPRVRKAAELVVEAVEPASAGSYAEVSIP